ncbi:MAG: enoyl-CoA hydratase-related protein [Bacteroidota bacterium]
MHLSIQNHVATLSFDRPEKANALREEDWEDLGNQLANLSTHEDVRVIVLTGQGHTFSAGIDLSTLQYLMTKTYESQAKKEEFIFEFIQKLQEAVNAIEKCTKPVIAAVNGPCIGGGLDMAAACDMRYCSDEAYFCLKEIDLGIVADLGVLQRLPYIINPGLVSEMAYTARKVYGPEAKDIGLVNNSFSSPTELMERVGALAREIALKPVAVVEGIKASMLHQRTHSIQEGLDWIARENAEYMTKMF